MEPILTARVALPVPVLKTFSYRIPPSLEGLCSPGSRVLVPFGRKRMLGVVVALEPADAPAQALRDLADVLEPSLVLNREMLEFTRWVAEYYFAPWGQVIQAAIPTQLRSRTRRRIALAPAGREVLDHPFADVSRDARRVLDLLARRGPVLEERLGGSPAAGPGPGLLQRLAARGWIQITEEDRPSRDRPAAPEWVAAQPQDGAVRGGKQRRILEILRSQRGPVRSRDLLRQAGASRSSLASLARQGRVRMERRLPEPPAAVTASAPQRSGHRLTPFQQRAVGELITSLDQGGFRAFLLEGVTGSGKTEVYLRAAAHALDAGKGVLYLVPEIGLTPLLAERLAERFPGRLAVLHSGLSEAHRREQWKSVREGRTPLVLGTRSALFAPHERIGLVVVDEEQDPSYFQTESPRYNARDAALVRAQRLGATAVLGSATPSLEAVAAVRRGKLEPLSLPSRVEGRPLPEVRLIDMREEFRATGAMSLLSRDLVAAIREIRTTGAQAVLFLNRRGFSTFVLCRACGKRLSCPRCSIGLTYHQADARLRCHYCNYQRLLPSHCPACRSVYLHLGGAGTERLEEALRIVDPSLRIARLDRDTAKGKGHISLLKRFQRGEIDLMLGTQMLAKGHDFPGVTLVGVLLADALLGLPDFRAAERTYQLLAQVAGRAGRGERPGRVLIQAFTPEHPALQAAASHDPRRFYERELHLRKMLGYPPYLALTQIRIEDRNRASGEAVARRLARRLAAAAAGEFEVLGPAPSPFPRLKGEYRFQILLKGERRQALARGIREALDAAERAPGRSSRVVVETDPRSLL